MHGFGESGIGRQGLLIFLNRLLVMAFATRSSAA